MTPFFCEGIALVSFLVRPPAGKRNVFLLTVGHHILIEELSAVIGIDAQYRERKERTCALDRCQHRLPAAVEKREAFGPARRNVREGQCVQVPSLCLYAAVGDQICFQKAGLRFIPVLKGTDGNLVFEQGSRSRGGHTMRMLLSRGAEKAISCRGAYGEQLVAVLLCEAQMPMPLQRFNEGGVGRGSVV